MVLAIPRFTKEKRAPVTSPAAVFYLMLLLATGLGGSYSGKWFVEGSGSGGGGRSGGWLIGGGGFWPTNVSVAIAVTAMAGLALAATIVYSRRGGLKSPWSRRKRKHALLANQWSLLFLPDGKLSDGGVKFLKKVRSGGVDPSIRAEVWPFLLGVYDLNSSAEERDAIKEHNRKQYEILRKQCKQITRRTEKGPGSKENTGSEVSGVISHCSELSDDIISHGGGYNSDFSGEISQVLDPIIESATNSIEDSPSNLKQDCPGSVYQQHPKEESFEGKDSVPRNQMDEKEKVNLNGFTSNPEKCVNSRESMSNENLVEESGSVCQNPKEGSFQNEDPVPQDLMQEKREASLDGATSKSSETLLKERNRLEESGSALKNIDSGVLQESTEMEGDESLDESTISDSSESDELEYTPPLFSSSELEQPNPDGALNPPPSEPEPSSKKSHSEEDFATWKRIIRLDAVRANDEWITYSPSQANVTQMKARRLARSVGLNDFDHLDACRVFHAARLVAILEAYAVYDPEIGYCQGMSDLLSPILSVIEDDAMAFWCFVGFMKKARHNFRLDEVGIRRQLNLVSKIIKCKDSDLYSHLEQLQAEDCFFVYRMVVVLFRRELDFDQTLCLWEVIWADQAAIRAGIAKSSWRRMRVRAPPTDDLLLFAIAACVLQRRKLIIEKYSSMEEIMRECNSMAGQLDVWKLLDDAHDLVVTLHDKV